MGESTSPVVERRRLAHELRQLRTASKRTIQEVAAALECSPGKISRIETGVVGARIGDVRTLLDIYEVHGEHRAYLLDLVRQARRRAWWHDYAGALPAECLRFFGLEDGADTIEEYSGIVVPGLLQTDDYARALIGTARGGADLVDLRAELRTRRAELLVRDNPPTIGFVVHEAALTVRFGGATAMAGQLDHLVCMSALPNVSIRVLPMDTREYAAAGTSFTIFRFRNRAPPIVHIDQLTSSVYREHPNELEVYGRAFAEMDTMALGPDESREIMIQRAASLRAKC